MKWGRILCVAGVALALAQPARAQMEDAHGKLVYGAVFFQPFSSANALQMVEQLPGFKLDGGDTTARGFSQAAGNVVINGQRPSSKSESLQTILERIPASRVVRIELEAGNAFGTDYAGKSQVANVILSDAGGIAGTLDAKLQRRSNAVLVPNGSVSLLFTRGASTFNGAFKLENMGLFEDGQDRLTILPSEALVETRAKVNNRHAHETTFALGWEYAPDAGHSAHLSAKIVGRPWNDDETSRVTLADGSARDDLFTQRHTTSRYELSGDVLFPLAGGTIKLNALATHRHRVWTDASYRSANGSQLDGKTQTLDDFSDERVTRLSWTRPDIAGWTLALDGEGDFNRLRSQVDLYALDAANQPTRVDLAIDHAVVTEYRGEAFASIGRALSKSVHLDLGLTYEASLLTVGGDVSARRVLKYLKPNASLDWMDGPWHTELGVQRTVAQLDFADFVSGADVNVDRVNGGNAELVPQRLWKLRASADRTILGDGRVKIELGYNHVSQVQDRVPTSDGFDAPGNLGNGSEWIAKTNVDLPMSRFGIKGGRLSLYGAYIDSAVGDPYTLTDRPFSGQTLFAYTVAFRQDLGPFAWGVTMSGDTGVTNFRRHETDRQRGISPNVSAFAEYRPNSRLTMAVGIENPANVVSKRWRDFYRPDRTALAPFQLEYRERKNQLLGYFSIKRSFG